MCDARVSITYPEEITPYELSEYSILHIEIKVMAKLNAPRHRYALFKNLKFKKTLSHKSVEVSGDWIIRQLSSIK